MLNRRLLKAINKKAPCGFDLQGALLFLRCHAIFLLKQNATIKYTGQRLVKKTCKKQKNKL